MKRLLSIFLALIMCTLWLVSCDNEDATSSSESQRESFSQTQSESEIPTQSESYSKSENESNNSSEESSKTDDEVGFAEQISSELLLGKLDYQNCTKETLNGITKNHFDPYPSLASEYLRTSYNSLVNDEEWLSDYDYATKLFLTYDEFAGGVVDEHVFDTITEQTFDDNYVIVVEGYSSTVRSKDIYYSDLIKKDGYYTLTYSLVSWWGLEASDAIQIYTDLVIVPKSVFQNEKSSIKIKIIEKDYYFEATSYDSNCKVTIYLSE